MPAGTALALRPEEEEGLLEQGQAEDEHELKAKTTFGFTPETKRKVWLLSGLFGLDNLAGGLVPV